MTLSEQIASYAINAKYEDLSPEIIDRMKLQLLDSTAVMAVGVHGTSVPGMVELVRSMEGKQEATVLFSNLKAPAHLAGWCNSLFMSAFDFAMTTGEGPNKMQKPHHASETDVPTAITAAEANGVNGKEFLMGLAIGNDIASRLACSTGSGYFGGKMGNRGTLNGISAACIAGRLYGLDQKQFIDALGITLMGLGGSNNDIGDNSTCTKLPVALATRTGIFSTQMAKIGFIGLLDPIGGSSGYYGLFGGGEGVDDIDLLTQDLGKAFYCDCEIKPWPGCRGTHKVDTLGTKMMKEHNIDPSKIVKIAIHQPPNVKLVGKKLNNIGERTLNALFNVRYSLAVLLTQGEVTPKYYCEEYYQNPDILRLHDMAEIEYGDFTDPTTLTITMEDGTVLHEETYHAYGDLHNDPISYEGVLAKFWNSVEFNGTIDKARAQEIVDVIKDIELINHMDELTKLLY